MSPDSPQTLSLQSPEQILAEAPKPRPETVHLNEEQALQYSKLMGLGRAASTITNELNNSMMIITAHLEELRRRVPPPVSMKDEKDALAIHVYKALETASRLGKMTHTLQRLGAGMTQKNSVPERVFIKEIADQSLEIYQGYFKTNKIDVFSLVNPRWIVNVSSLDICQAFMHLFDNCVQSIAHQRLPWIQLETTQRGAWIAISITDSGNGTHPAQDLSRAPGELNDPFLNVSLAFQLVLRNQGHLWHDKSHHHNRFVIELPTGLG